MLKSKDKRNYEKIHKKNTKEIYEKKLMIKINNISITIEIFILNKFFGDKFE